MMKKKQSKSFLTSGLLTAALCAAMALSSQAATSSSTAGTVNTSWGTLTVRASASTSSAKLASLAKGSAVTLLSRSGNWWKVEYAAGKTGWCSADYLTEISGSRAASVATASGPLNVRSGASTAYSVITQLPKGSTVVELSRSNGWSRILYNGTKTGYVSSSYLTLLSDGAVSSAVSLSVPSYKQYDSRWANIVIGNYGQTMRQIGCTTAALAMTESYRTGSTLTPATMTYRLGYTAGGAVYWPARYSAYTGSDYLTVIKTQLAAGRPVIVGAKNASGGAHWVVVTGHNGNSSLRASDFTINDPGSEWRTNLSQLFANYPYFYKLEYYTY